MSIASDVAFDRQVYDNIKRTGRHLQGVFPTAADPTEIEPFVYSVGMSLQFQVELLLIGRFPSGVCAGILNALGAKFKESGVVNTEGMVDIDWSVPVKLRPAGDRAKEDYTLMVRRFLPQIGDEYDVVQVMLCDKYGVYQDDPKCVYGLVDMP